MTEADTEGTDARTQPDRGDDRPDSALDTGFDRAVDGVAADARSLDDETRRLVEEGEQALRKIAGAQALLDRIRDLKVRAYLKAKAWAARN